jgi:pimeloyl-ACP methyl ester carboxylesterase
MHHARILSAAFLVSLLAAFAGANEVATPQKWPAGAAKTTGTRFSAVTNGATGCTIGPLSPPDTSDQLYVADCSSTFDVIVHNTDPSPQANIRVSRVAGDVDKLRASGLIGAKATIMISAFDVNTGDYARVPRGAPQEHDKVFFNDHELGILVGAGGQWRITTFEIPVDWINFAHDNGGGPPVPADNVVRIKVDADNIVPVWSTEIDWVSLEFHVVRPIILAHGGFSSGDTWRPFWVGNLDALGIPHDEIDFPEGGKRTIGENSGALSKFLDDHLRRWGVDKVNIEAHSKGGLDSRDMVENRGGVDRVAMVGTPHCGMRLFDLATVISHLGGFLPIGIVIDIKAPLIPQLTTPSMKIYNRYHGRNPNVRYSTLAGVYHAHTLSPYKALQAIVGLGDLIVSQKSAQCLSWSFNTKYESYGNNHNAQHWNETSAGPAFDSLWNLVRAVPSSTLQPAAQSVRTVAANDFDEEADFAFTASTPASVQTGETKSFAVPVDEAHPAAFSILYSGTAIGAELVAPSGIHYTWDQVWDEASGITNGDAEVPTTQARIKSYTFDAPEVGVWTLNVTGVDAGATSFAVTGMLQTPSTAMDAAVETEAVHLGTPLRVRATVTRGGAALSGVTATALVTLPDDSQQQITLHEGGVSGVYSGEVATPVAGAYDFVVTAEDHRPNQPAFSRQSIVRGTVSASLTRFEGPYSDIAFDTDNDHGLDTLLVTGFLNVVEPGTYRLFGVLTDLAGNEVTTAPFQVTMPFSGLARFSLPFPGAGIYASAANGPYKLNLRLAEERSGAILPIQEENGVYTTASYYYYLFGAPPPPDKFATKVTVDPASGPYQGPATLVAHLTDADGNPLTNRFLTFQVGFSTAGFGVTDATGTATLTDAYLSSLYYLGGYRLDAFFAGDPKYAASSGQSTFYMGQGTQTITWTPPTQVPPGTILSPDNILTATVTGSGIADPATLVYEPGEGTPLQAGTQVITVTAPATDFYAEASKSVTINVGYPAATVTWTNPAAIVHGTPLSSTQLNATADTAGTFTYNPPAGTILDAGTQQLHVTFVPSSPGLTGATKTVTIDVIKANQTIAWSDPAPIVYGTPLSSTQLNATVTRPSTLTYTPAAGVVLNAGSHTLTATAAATPNYNAATSSVTLLVQKATPAVTWSAPAPIVYGTPLSSAQLNATANVPGTFTYSPAAGTILNAGNGQTLSVTFTPSDAANYNSSSATTAIDVAKASTAIAWSAPAPIVYGTPLSSAQLNATANVPGTFAYSPAAGTILNAGNGQTLSVAFTPSDGANYTPSSATTAIDVAKAEQSIQWSNPADIVYGTPLSFVQLNATVTGPGALTYAPPAGTILDAGSRTLTVTAAATPNYNAATASVTLLVTKATPSVTWSAPASIVYGTPLSAMQLDAAANVPGSFTYSPAAGTILNAGSGQTLSVTFAPADSANYTTANATTTIDVAKATQTIAWTAPAAIVYGTPLGGVQLNATVTVIGPAPHGALTYTPASGTVLDAGNAQTLTVVAAETPNYEAASGHVAIDVNRAPLSLRADDKTKLYGAAVPPLTGTLTGVVNHDAIGAAYTTSATAASAAGTYAIAASLVDPNGRLRNYDVTITNATLSVTPAPLSISANDAAKQYSDAVPQLTAAFQGFVLGETPAVLGGTLSIATTATKTSAPGTYPIAIGGLSSPNYAIVFTGGTLTVTQEDARTLFTAPAAASGPGSVTLSSTVLDISATAAADGDADPGDIRNATLTFVDRVSGETLCTAPLAFVDAGDARIATGTCSFSATIRAYQVGTRIGGYYLRDAAADDVTINVAAPTEDFITGGGSILSSQSAGARSAANGTPQKFNFELAYDKSGAVKGLFRVAFSRTEDGQTHDYVIEADPAAISLSFVHTAERGVAYAAGAATLTDVTDARQPLVVAAAAPMLLTVVDDSPAQTPQKLSLALFNRSGGLWFSSSWDGTRTTEQPLANGEVQIHWKK